MKAAGIKQGQLTEVFSYGMRQRFSFRWLP